jgi:hypothetical protein
MSAFATHDLGAYRALRYPQPCILSHRTAGVSRLACDPQFIPNHSFCHTALQAFPDLLATHNFAHPKMAALRALRCPGWTLSSAAPSPPPTNGKDDGFTGVVVFVKLPLDRIQFMQRIKELHKPSAASIAAAANAGVNNSNNSLVDSAAPCVYRIKARAAFTDASGISQVHFVRQSRHVSIVKPSGAKGGGSEESGEQQTFHFYGSNVTEAGAQAWLKQCLYGTRFPTLAKNPYP